MQPPVRLTLSVLAIMASAGCGGNTSQAALYDACMATLDIEDLNKDAVSFAEYDDPDQRWYVSGHYLSTTGQQDIWTCVLDAEGTVTTSAP